MASRKPPSPGDVLLTTYGVAVVISICEPSSEIDSDKDYTAGNQNVTFKARLWREPGKSVGSSATAFLQCGSILKELPAAPGMTTTLVENDDPNGDIDTNNKEKQRNVLIHRYSPWNDSYLVSNVTEDSPEQQIRDSIVIQSNSIVDESIETTADELVGNNASSLFEYKSMEVAPSKSSKFYPLIDDLINRGNEASASAKAAIKENPKMNELILNTSGLSLTNYGSSESESKSHRELKASNSIVEAASSLKDTIPNAEEVSDIYKMLKDEELTVLLQKGQERLRHLVSGDIPAATKDALSKMGVEITESNSNGITGAMVQAQKEALEALDKLLEENIDMDMEAIRSSLGDAFSTAFDSLSTAAESDSLLCSIVNEISVKTTEWQEQTGRLLQTRSSCLFFEGAQRLQHRVGNYFSQEQLVAAQDSTSQFTKAFSEGDAALARLKSIELGESIRSRLIMAIEIRSDSEGGLDGIIAGAINKINAKTDDADKGVQSMMASLQNSVSSHTENAQESLISFISESSKYQDGALIRLEQVLVNLADHVGDDVSGEEIAAMARCEGGTATLFTPIARGAANEINKQLDAAEQSVTDPTFISVLSHVRRIVSGELTMTGLVDEMLIVLNDDKVVRHGESIVQKGEYLLDAIENASENTAVGDMMAVVEKAGLTKDSVLGKIEKLNVDDLLETAEGAYGDENKRRELLSSATDSALDFLLRILPSMPVPPFEGVKDGLIYSIKNLSMHGFKVRKEDIMVEISGIRASDQSGASMDMEKKTESNGIEEPRVDYSVASYGPIDGFLDTNDPLDSFQSRDFKLDDLLTRNVKATELLIIDVRNISATFDKASWSFEQTYLPYLKKSGLANVKLSDGHIRLQFELRKKPVKNEKIIGKNDVKWEPVLCLHQRTCTIGNVNLSFEGEGRVTWLINKLASMLKNPLRDYVVQVLLLALLNKSGWLLEQLNSILSSYWELILKTAGLTMDDLVEASEDDIIAATLNENEIDLVWTEFVPLGINLLTDLNRDIQVVDFPRGSQARRSAIKMDLDPDIFMGSAIKGVNGTSYGIESRAELVAALKDPSRPKTIKFELVKTEELQKAREFATRVEKFKDHGQNKKKTKIPNAVVSHRVKSVNIVDDGPIGIKFAKSIDGCALVIDSFSEEGCARSFEQNGSLALGDLLISINNNRFVGGDGSWIEQSLKSLELYGSIRPLRLGFVKSYLELITFEPSANTLTHNTGPEDEFKLEEKVLPGGGNMISLKSFQEVDGVAETGGIFIGDRLLFINGNPVGTGHHLQPSKFNKPTSSIGTVQYMLQDPKAYPMGLTFARPSCTRMRKSESDLQTFNIVAPCYNQLGFVLKEDPSSGNLVINSFHGVTGYFQEELSRKVLLKNTGLQIKSIDGQGVPSYATCDIVINAMKRNWKKNGKLEILFCDEQERQWLSSLEKE